MKEVLQAILDLQPHWVASAPSESMTRRGQLVRRHAVNWIRGHQDALATTLLCSPEELIVEGRDAIGSFSRVPWIRVANRRVSSNPRTGWYVVYLFAEDGSAAYLSLNQGTQVWDGMGLRPQPVDEIRARSAWAHDALGDELLLMTGLARSIALGPNGKSESYEAGNVVARVYESGQIPPEQELAADLFDFVSLLRALQREGASGIAPGDLTPEIAEVERSVRVAAGRKAPPRSGFRANAKERKAIELRAMELAVEYFREAGALEINDVSARKPYDLEVRWADGTLLTVEVKGTMGEGAEILLTRGEVAHHLEAAPANALVVVSGIRLDRNPSFPKGIGGRREVLSPWIVDSQQLRPLAYRYALSGGDQPNAEP